MSEYTSPLAHLIFIIVEASSQQAIENGLPEVGWASWNTVEILQVEPVEEVTKRVVG